MLQQEKPDDHNRRPEDRERLVTTGAAHDLATDDRCDQQAAHQRQERQAGLRRAESAHDLLVQRQVRGGPEEGEADDEPDGARHREHRVAPERVGQDRLGGATLGKLLFGFTVFWAYIGFSQYFLIWYANIPEETGWFKERFAGGWCDEIIEASGIPDVMPRITPRAERVAVVRAALPDVRFAPAVQERLFEQRAPIEEAQVPEPEWLRDLAISYDDPNVAESAALSTTAPALSSNTNL